MYINLKNEALIDSVLKEVNGDAIAYTYSTASGIRLDVTCKIEVSLGHFGIPRTSWTGVTAEIEYGTIMITLCRGTKDWFLTSASACKRRPEKYPNVSITVPLKVVELAEQKRRRQYNITVQHSDYWELYGLAK